MQCLEYRNALCHFAYENNNGALWLWQVVRLTALAVTPNMIDKHGQQSMQCACAVQPSCIIAAMHGKVMHGNLFWRLLISAIKVDKTKATKMPSTNLNAWENRQLSICARHNNPSFGTIHCCMLWLVCNVNTLSKRSRCASTQTMSR